MKLVPDLQNIWARNRRKIARVKLWYQFRASLAENR